MPTAALDELRNEVIATVHGQKEWLEALTVACPPKATPAAWQTEVEQMLFDLHLDGIDVRVNGPAESGPWILERHMGPGWA